MDGITKEQIKRVYSLGAGAGILERGSKDDDLHALVFNLTEKNSISELSGAEFSTVERELLRLMRYDSRPAPMKTARRKKGEDVPGMMTEAQQNLAWRMIYRLCELDERKGATPGERMCGAIRKILGIEAGIEAPFRWVDFDAGARLIEQLKRYVRSAEKKKKEAG